MCFLDSIYFSYVYFIYIFMLPYTIKIVSVYKNMELLCFLDQHIYIKSSECFQFKEVY